MHHSFDESRLAKILTDATNQANDAEIQEAEKQNELSKERTQYFEKIALGSGATIAAIVSLAGSHPGRFQPSWILRSALLSLGAAMAAAMYRNWRYPYYVVSVMQGFKIAALQRREKAKRDFFLAVPANSIQDGKRIDGVAWAKGHVEVDQTLTDKILELKRSEKSARKQVKFSENTTLIFLGVAACFLIALVWKNL